MVNEHQRYGISHLDLISFVEQPRANSNSLFEIHDAERVGYILPEYVGSCPDFGIRIQDSLAA